MITETVRRAQAGDTDAFAELYRAHRNLVHRLLWRLCHDVSRAEDLTQDTFLQAFRKLSHFRGEARFSSWLGRIAYNLFYMDVRRQNRLPEFAPLEIPASDGALLSPAVSQRDLILEGAIDRAVLFPAIVSLPPSYRRVFELKEVEGLEHHEVAARLGCSVGTSKSQLHKAKVKLRKILRKGGSLCRHSTLRARIPDASL